MIVPTAALLAMMGVTVYTTADAAAEQTSLIDRIIAQFNLNKNDVQKVVDEERTQRRQAKQERMVANLDDAVAHGKITEEQKNLIRAKHEEVQKTRAQHMPGNRDANQAARAQERQAMEQWAKDNNIDTQYLMMGNGMGCGGERGCTGTGVCTGAGKGGMQRGGNFSQR